MRKVFLVLILLSFTSQAQVSWEGSYNRLGIKAGVNRFNLVSNQLDFEPRFSWTAGFTTRSSFYEDFQFIYGISFYDFKTQLQGRDELEQASEVGIVPFNMIGVQGSFLGSYKIAGHHLSIEAGPVIQVNGKLDARQDKELFYIQEYDFRAVDMEKISPISLNFAFGVSGGFEVVKFWINYQHGINNMLSKLNNGDLSSADPSAPDFEGRLSLISGGVVFFL